MLKSTHVHLQNWIFSSFFFEENRDGILMTLFLLRVAAAFERQLLQKPSNHIVF